MQIEDVEIPEYVKGFLSEPGLLEGEDPSLYWKMFAKLLKERSPELISDWIAINDVATKLWEERIYRRSANAIIQAGKLFAVQQVMEAIESGETLKSREIHDKPAQRANKYFRGNNRDRDEMRLLLAKFGIKEYEIYAMAAQYHSDALLMFERMITSRERARRKLRKEDRARSRSTGSKSIPRSE